MRSLLFLLTLILISCESNRISGDEYTIIDYGNNEWTFMFKNATSSSLSRNEIEQIEKIIKERIENHKDSFNDWVNDYLETNTPIFFKRQYVPVILENGNKAVWINFLCSLSNHEDWKEKLIIVDDGGPCYFQVKVNLARKEYYEFHSNGVALK